jgi:hypothetical protein
MNRARTPDPLKLMLIISEPQFADEKILGPRNVDIVIPPSVERANDLTAAEINFDTVWESLGPEKNNGKADVPPDWIDGEAEPSRCLADRGTDRGILPCLSSTIRGTLSATAVVMDRWSTMPF